jgi:Secretion system C-terminal sorting domain/Bacterial pre-peptidase C-terminal domain/Fibronectin type III domain
MRKLLLLAVTFFCMQMINAQQNANASTPIVITGHLVKVTKPLRDFKASDKAIPDVTVRDMDGIIGKDEAFEEGAEAPFGKSIAKDPALQSAYPNLTRNITPNNAITSNFAGIGNQPLNPPDPTMCVGPNHIIQMINGSSGALLQIYNKAGAVLVATKFMDAITGKGGLGDPIALYDQLADRYVITEFNNKAETTTEGLTFAVSQTNDPTGAWYVYFFSTGTTFPDYPKFSVWTDAYYGTTNDFANGSSYSGSTVYAFDRAKMIAGNATATVQKFTLGTTNKHFSMSPVCLEGTTLPPSGTGGLIAYMNDNAWSGSATDSIGLFEFKVNFTTPSLSSVLTKSSLAVTAYKSDICTATRGQCIAMPGTATKVEALHQKIMNQPIYRNFGTFEGIVLTHVVDKGTNISGVRWYELTKTSGNWSVNQQSTYSPDATHRWMPAICYDAAGNIGLAYNVSASITTFPGARYTGRKSCDALNSMTYAESVIIAGSAANASTRYGDYNQLVADPDGVRFWFTCEYNPASAWSTRIASFTLDNCTPTLCGDPTGLTSSAITNTSAMVSWAAVASAVSYDVDYKLTSSATWTNVATATASTSVNITGLTEGTAYDWRVRATCSAGSGNYVGAQFTTTAPATCNAPTALTSSGVSSNSATVSFTAVSGAANYDVDYKLNPSATWTNAATATTSTSVALSGLTASSLYDWRVRANCTPVGLSSTYSQAQFTTTAASVCGTAFEPNETQAAAAAISSGVTNSAAITTTADIDYFKITTTATAGIVYNLVGPSGVDYDMTIFNSAGTQIGAGTGSTATETVSLTNQAAGTYYIKVFGFSGANSATCYTIKATATVVTGCASALDNSTNGTISGAATIPFNTNVTGLISPTGDIDNYKFVITTGGTITITLGTLPGDYDLKLLNSAGTQLAISQNGSTTGETINFTAAAGTYYAQVFGFNGANSAVTCYTLKVQLGTASKPEMLTNAGGIVKVYPNPVSNVLNVSVLGDLSPKASLQITDASGKVVITKNIIQNPQAINISKLAKGVYIIKVNNDGKEITSKFIKE